VLHLRAVSPHTRPTRGPHRRRPRPHPTPRGVKHLQRRGRRIGGATIAALLGAATLHPLSATASAPSAAIRAVCTDGDFRFRAAALAPAGAMKGPGSRRSWRAPTGCDARARAQPLPQPSASIRFRDTSRQITLMSAPSFKPSPFQAIRTGECAFFRRCDVHRSDLMIVAAGAPHTAGFTEMTMKTLIFGAMAMLSLAASLWSSAQAANVPLGAQTRAMTTDRPAREAPAAEFTGRASRAIAGRSGVAAITEEPIPIHSSGSS
jgi:hypothetical protein